MNEPEFDAIVRLFPELPARRRVIGGLAAVLGFGALGFPGETEARNRRKKHKKGLQENTYGCVDVGKPCRGNSVNCCSGICEGSKPKKGKKDKSRCVGHGAGSCQLDEGTCAATGTVCGPINVCLQTTGKGCYCASTNGACAVCRRDSDCVALGWGPDAACIPSEGCPDTGGTYCAAP